MRPSFLTALYYIGFPLLGLVLGYFLGFNLFLLICDLFGVIEPPYWLNVLFAAGFAIVVAMIYLVVALILHGIKIVTDRFAGGMATFATNLIATLFNKKWN